VASDLPDEQSDPSQVIIRTDNVGQVWGHSYGNKPYMPFYNADKEMREKLLEVAREVFREGGRQP